jgi:hypothetical protein
MRIEGIANGHGHKWDDRTDLGFRSASRGLTFHGRDQRDRERRGDANRSVTGWIGPERKPFALLGDGARLRGVDAAYRSAWGKFLLQHREDSYVAFFNMNALIRVAAEMFGIGARLRLKTFGDEAAARAWLRGVGISA